MSGVSAKKAFTGNLNDIAEQLRRFVAASVERFPMDADATRQRRERAGRDLEFFARTYFPHYIQSPNSVLHDWLYRRLPKLADDRRGRHLAIAAPRGEAKSTICSQIFALWCLVTGRKHYIVLVMDAADQANTMLEAVKAELECNPRLETDFPEACGPGRVWREGVIVTANNNKMQAFGSGKRIRGLRHGPYRPDLAVCDDLENDENVRSAEQRDKLEMWFRKSILKLGPPDGSMDVLLIGTVLHYDSVLSRVLNDKTWETMRFQSVIRWPDNMDLWDQWEAIYRNDGEDAAGRFFKSNRREMVRGAEVSWPDCRPIEALMAQRARDGHAAFDSEQQNDPVSMEESYFAGNIRFWGAEDPEWIFYGAVDPSLGRLGNARDPCAILVGGFNRRTGVLSVVEAKIARMLPDRIIEEVIAQHRIYNCRRWVVESVQFQEFFRTELVNRSAVGGVPVPAQGVTPATDKALRIESLQPHVANGLILLHQDQKTLIQQMTHYPKADHDDGPDALHMLWAAAHSGPVIGGVQSTGRREMSDRATRTNTGWGTVRGSLNMDGY